MINLIPIKKSFETNVMTINILMGNLNFRFTHTTHTMDSLFYIHYSLKKVKAVEQQQQSYSFVQSQVCAKIVLLI